MQDKQDPIYRIITNSTLFAVGISITRDAKLTEDDKAIFMSAMKQVYDHKRKNRKLGIKHLDSFLQTQFRDKQADILNDSTVWIVRAHTFGRVVGFAAFKIATTLAEVSMIAVDPTYARIGIGTVLLSMVHACAEEVSCISVWTRKHNEQSIAFFEKHLFSIVDEVQHKKKHHIDNQLKFAVAWRHELMEFLDLIPTMGYFTVTGDKFVTSITEMPSGFDSRELNRIQLCVGRQSLIDFLTPLQSFEVTSSEGLSLLYIKKGTMWKLLYNTKKSKNKMLAQS